MSEIGEGPDVGIGEADQGVPLSGYSQEVIACGKVRLHAGQELLIEVRCQLKQGVRRRMNLIELARQGQKGQIEN